MGMTSPALLERSRADLAVAYKLRDRLVALGRQNAPTVAVLDSITGDLEDVLTEEPDRVR
jgi:hypothetical protein